MSSDDKPSVVIPVAREEASIARETVETGVVNVRKVVRERVEVIDEPMLHDEVHIEHVTINREVAAPEPPREEGDVLVIPVYEEVNGSSRKKCGCGGAKCRRATAKRSCCARNRRSSSARRGVPHSFNARRYRCRRR